jgi:uncharacterized phiE125 gp8 family phage protein
MALSLVTAPELEPVSLDAAKTYLHVDVDDENGLIQELIVAAREHAETYTRRALITQTWDLKLDAFPCSDSGIWLPKPPVISVSSITYVDTNGVTQTWSSSLYETDFPSGPKAVKARVQPAYGQYYPITRVGVFNAVTVRFVCGYGAAEESVPSSIKTAMLVLIAHWYAHREPVVVGSTANEIPATVDAHLWPYIAW